MGPGITKGLRSNLHRQGEKEQRALITRHQAKRVERIRQNISYAALAYTLRKGKRKNKAKILSDQRDSAWRHFCEC